MIRWFSVGAVLAAACGVSDEEFADRYVQARCERFLACAGDGTAVLTFADEADCVAFIGGLTQSASDGCDYDRKAAKDCLDDLDAVKCDVINSGDPIGACDAVFTGPDCAWSSPAS